MAKYFYNMGKIRIRTMKSTCHLVFKFVLGVLLASAVPAIAQGLNFTTNTCPIGNEPACVITADVNGDGKLDLVSADYLSNSIVVCTNNGSGVFGSNAVYSVGSNPVSVVAADINGDGKLDLINVNYGSQSLTVLTNNGTGHFVLSAAYEVGTNPCSVAVADINQDGKPDIICANMGSDTLSIFTNAGNGLSSYSATLVTGVNPVCVVAADVNGDGRPDLVCANRGDNTVTIFTNNGSGFFGSNAVVAVGSQPSCVTTTDVNGDGKVDLICANSGDGTLTVFTNNGYGRFGSNAVYTVDTGAGAQLQWVTAADVNNDGKVDLICALAGESAVMIFTNNGTGGFGFNTSVMTGNGPFCVAAADLNNDGSLDLVSANVGTNTLTVMTQIPSPKQLTEFVPSTLAVSNGPNCVIAADINGDGKPDLISANYGTNAGGFTLSVLTNNGSGSFGSNATIVVGSPISTSPIWIAAADVNGDGKPDFAPAARRPAPRTHGALALQEDAEF